MNSLRPPSVRAGGGEPSAAAIITPPRSELATRPITFVLVLVLGLPIELELDVELELESLRDAPRASSGPMAPLPSRDGVTRTGRPLVDAAIPRSAGKTL